MSIFSRNTTAAEFARERPVSTFLIIANSIMLLVTLATGGFEGLNLYKLGGLIAFAFRDGEYYRLITTAFLHGSIIHFLSNMIIGISFLGSALEKTIGSVKFTIIYIVALLGSGLLVVFTTEVLTIGASGGVFGLLGALLYISINRTDMISERDKQTIWTFTAIQVFFTLMSFDFRSMTNTGGISIAGHFGGLISGFLIAFILIGPRKESDYDIYY